MASMLVDGSHIDRADRNLRRFGQETATHKKPLTAQQLRFQGRIPTLGFGHHPLVVKRQSPDVMNRTLLFRLVDIRGKPHR